MKRLGWMGLFLLISQGVWADWTITTDFPGGNIQVDRVEGNTAYLRPDLRETRGDWFYFAFRVRGAEGQTLTFEMDAPNRLEVLGPAISSDDGKTWRFLYDKRNRDSQKFTYSFAADEKNVLFATSILYTQKEWDTFTASYQNRENFHLETLCQSRKNRPVELLRIAPTQGIAPWGVVMTARHHACEMTVNWLLEGFLAEVLSDSEDGRWLREHCEFFVVPFMDKDGVEEGDQGKNRKPHDHNRDYAQEIYPEVRTLKAEVQKRFADRPLCFMDFHCPGIRHGEHQESLFSPGPESPRLAAELERFSRFLEETQKTGAIPYRASDNMPFGTSWNVSSNYARPKGEPPTMGSKQWFATLPNIQLDTGWELSYAMAGDTTISPTTVRELGRNMARALRRYLEETERNEK